MQGKILPEVCNRIGTQYKAMEIEWAKPKRQKSPWSSWGDWGDSSSWGSWAGSSSWGDSGWAGSSSWRQADPDGDPPGDPQMWDPHMAQFHAQMADADSPEEPLIGEQPLIPHQPLHAPPPWRLAKQATLLTSTSTMEARPRPLPPGPVPQPSALKRVGVHFRTEDKQVDTLDFAWIFSYLVHTY